MVLKKIGDAAIIVFFICLTTDNVYIVWYIHGHVSHAGMVTSQVKMAATIGQNDGDFG